MKLEVEESIRVPYSKWITALVTNNKNLWIKNMVTMRKFSQVYKESKVVERMHF